MADDVVVKKETKNKVARESDLERDARDLGDKTKAAAKAVSQPIQGEMLLSYVIAGMLPLSS